MMNKTKHIKQSQLTRLVEQALNELDWRTYDNAQQKMKERLEDAGETGWYKTKMGQRYLKRALQKKMGKDVAEIAFSHLHDPFWKYNNHLYGFLDNIFRDEIRNELKQKVSDFGDARTASAQEQLGQIKDASRYVQGKGWTNESVQKIIDGAIRILKEGCMKEWTSQRMDSTEEDSPPCYVAEFRSYDDINATDVEKELGKLIATTALNNDDIGDVYSALILYLHTGGNWRIYLDVAFSYTNTDKSSLVDDVDVRIGCEGREEPDAPSLEWGNNFVDSINADRITEIANGIIKSEQTR